MGKNTRIINSTRIVAEKLADYLKRHQEIEKKLKKQHQRLFYTTDTPGRFKNLGEKFLRIKIKKVEKIALF